MANCIIHPIPLVERSGDKSEMTYRLNFGQIVRPITYSWYIEGTKDKILVDAGLRAQFLLTTRNERVNEIQTLEAGLHKLGISYNDIDIIILTHLHHDHVAEASRFPRAKCIVQQRELEFARNPHPLVAAAYNRELIDGLDFEVVNGDTKICEEISVLSTPGHSPGGQSVSVKTAQGTAIIAGICTIRENFYPPPGTTSLPVIIPGTHINAFEAYDSLIRIKEIADIIVPSHEPELRKKSSIP